MDILKEIRKTAKEHGERIAIKSEEESLTYAQLEEYSDCLAVWLQQNMPDSKTPVVVYGHKNSYMVVCFLACVKAGRGYCPQDISIPMIRVIDTIESVKPDVVFVLEGKLELSEIQTVNLAELKNERESTWNKGYDKKYLSDQGALYRTISRHFWRLLCLQDAIRHSQEYGISIQKALFIMIKGGKCK